MMTHQDTALRDLQVCTNGLKSWATDWQERQAAVGGTAIFLAEIVTGLKEAGVPLHYSFVRNAALFQHAIQRVAWWSASVVTSPYFQHYQAGTTVLAQCAAPALRPPSRARARLLTTLLHAVRYAADARVDLVQRRGRLGTRPVLELTTKTYKRMVKDWRKASAEALAEQKGAQQARGAAGAQDVAKQVSDLVSTMPRPLNFADPTRLRPKLLAQDAQSMRTFAAGVHSLAGTPQQVVSDAAAEARPPAIPHPSMGTASS
jgi:hypothetical protein